MEERREKADTRKKKRRKVKDDKEENKAPRHSVPESFKLLTGLQFSPNFFASVPTGLEEVTIEEIKQKLEPLCVFSPVDGKVVFTTTARTPLQVAQALRSVDKLYVCVQIVQNVQRPKANAEQYFEDLAKSFDWEPSIESWKACNPVLSSTIAEDKPLRFRVTFHRATCLATRNIPRAEREEEYTSMEAASWFGGGVYLKLNWEVDLSNYDVEVCQTLRGRD